MQDQKTPPVRRFFVKKDGFIFAALCAVFLLSLFSARLTLSSRGETAVVRVNGEITARYSLNSAGTYAIQGTNGTVTLRIENGRASVVDADCRDFVCVHSAPIDRAGQSIVCLPNRVTVSVEGGKNTQIDGVVQ